MTRIINILAKPRNPPEKSSGKTGTPEKALPRGSFGLLGRFIRKAAIVSGTAAVCWLWFLRPVYITGNAMFPALKDGDLCIVYRDKTYYTGNLVVYTAEDGEVRAGRITAAAGQEISFPETGGYTVDGYQPAEEIQYPTYKAQDGELEYPLVVPEDSFFIMNDFRSDDDDSRSCGCIAGKDIIGRVVFLFRRRSF